MSDARQIELRSEFDARDEAYRLGLEFTEDGEITLMFRNKETGRIDRQFELSFSDVDRLGDELAWARDTFKKAR